MHHFFKPAASTSARPQTSKMNGKIATFNLVLFNEFIESYKVTNFLAPEALEAFSQFLPALDRFFGLYEELTTSKINDAVIKWCSSSVISNSDTIRALSNWYHQAAFDNISIYMDNNETEDYITHDEMCFGKVITD